MAILKIVQYPDLRLKRHAIPVADVNQLHIQKTLRNMTETLLKQKNCAGLAATQLDLPEPPAIVTINLSTKPRADQILYLINPEITFYSPEENIDNEGCMSIFPNRISAPIKRATKIRVKNWDLHGKPYEFTATDFLARCIQHECDHLKGVIYIDHLNPTERVAIEQQIAAI